MNDELTELLKAAGKVAQAARPKEFELDLEDFLSRFYEDVAPEDLVGKDPMDVVGPATHMLRLGANRPQGTAVVDVFTPTVAANEWTCGHTVVQVITDDMPFLLDSVVAAITEQGKALHLVAHPMPRRRPPGSPGCIWRSTSTRPRQPMRLSRSRFSRCCATCGRRSRTGSG